MIEFDKAYLKVINHQIYGFLQSVNIKVDNFTGWAATNFARGVANELNFQIISSFLSYRDGMRRKEQDALLAKEKELQDKIKTHTTPVRDLVNDWTVNAVKRYLANEMPMALTEYDRANKIPKNKPHQKENLPSGPFHPGNKRV